MYDTIVFRQRAQHCMEQADDPMMPVKQQRMLLRTAAKWIELAEDAERINELIGTLTGTGTTSVGPH